ncbi:unnamed protein product [Amaranthus hypochondriacus]
MGEVEPSKMAAPVRDLVTWDEIDLAESYLVSGMFEEAATMSASALKHLHDNRPMYVEDKITLLEMMESSAMVLAQSWKGAGRTSDLFKELEFYFGSVTAIPVQVVLTSACVLISDGHPTRVRDFLEEFFAKWQFNDEKYYPLSCQDVSENIMFFPIMEVDQYLKVVEFYALTLLAVVLNDVDHAVAWVEKAELPEEARQDFLRRLLSLYPLKSSISTHGAVSVSAGEEPETCPLSLKEVKQSDKPMTVMSTQRHNGMVGTKHTIWTWLQDMIQKSCNSIIAYKGKIFMGCLIFLICYYIRKKRESVKRAVQMRVSSVKKALLDFWNLAFSYQVNPLAAVQPLPTAMNRSR